MDRFIAVRLTGVAAASAAFLFTAAHAAVPPSASHQTMLNDVQIAGLAWRCGKRNPAEWGTFGNGCLKQKRAARRNAAAVDVEQPAGS